MKRSLKLYLLLFWYSLKISTFTFGGGYVIVSMMKKQFVDKLSWLSEKEMLDFVSMAQAIPGPIAVSSSMLVGLRIAGVIGGIMTVLGTVLPPFLIISVISVFYSAFRSNLIISYILLGMQAGAAAVVTDAVISLCATVWKENRFFALAIAVMAFAAVCFFDVNIFFVLIGAVICGFVYFRRKGEGV